MQVPYDEGPISSRRDVEVLTPIVPCSEYLAGFELVTDTEDDDPAPVSAKFTSPVSPGDRRRRIANISQLKPYYAVDTRDTIDDGITGASNPAR